MSTPMGATTELAGFVHTFVPASGDARTLLLLHGTGGNEHDLVPLGQALAPGAGLLSPRGQILENGMPRFFRRLANGVFDMDDLVDRTHRLADFVVAARERYGLTGGQMTAVGFSNGANVAASMLLLRPEILSAALLLRAMVPLEPDELPDLSGVPVLIAGGRTDTMIPQDQTERLAALLSRAKANVTVHWSPAGHGLDGSDLEAGRAWLASAAAAPA